MKVHLKSLGALCLGICLYGVAFPQRSAQGQTLADRSNFRGIYMLLDPRVTQNGNRPMYDLYQSALQSTDIDGVTIIMPWTNMYTTSQPGPGSYNWALLDTWTSAAQAHGKVISLGVVAGMYTPAWLLAAPYSVPAHEFTFNSGPVSKADCVTRLLPSPWVPAYLHAYKQMILDLAAHLQATGAYSAVKLVKVGGLNEETQELGVGATRVADYNCPLNNSEYLTEGWAKEGFTPARIFRAWHSISQTISVAFPNALLSVDILASQEAFPAVDASGRVLATPAGPTDAITASIVSETLLPGLQQRNFHSRFAVQWDALSSGAVDPEVLLAGQMGAQIGWQMNDGLGGQGANCVTPTGSFGVCAGPAQYQAMLDNGINLGGQFIEVMATDVLQFPSAFHEPHHRLTGAAD